MTDEPTPFPVDDLDDLLGMAERFGAAAAEWLQWAANFEAPEPGPEVDPLGELHWALRHFDAALSAPVRGQYLPELIDQVTDAARRSEIGGDAVMVAALALRIVVHLRDVEQERQ